MAAEGGVWGGGWLEGNRTPKYHIFSKEMDMKMRAREVEVEVKGIQESEAGYTAGGRRKNSRRRKPSDDRNNISTAAAAAV